MNDVFNDFQNMVRSDDIAGVIDLHRAVPGRECLTPGQRRSRCDVLGVLDAIYAARPSSHAALIRLASICARLNEKQFALLVHVLRGGTFSEYAMGEGVTGAAVGQRWSTVLRKCPELEGVKR